MQGSFAGDGIESRSSIGSGEEEKQTAIREDRGGGRGRGARLPRGWALQTPHQHSAKIVRSRHEGAGTFQTDAHRGRPSKPHQNGRGRKRQPSVFADKNGQTHTLINQRRQRKAESWDTGTQAGTCRYTADAPSSPTIDPQSLALPLAISA